MKAIKRSKFQKCFRKCGNWPMAALSTTLLVFNAAGQPSNDLANVRRLKQLSFDELQNVSVTLVSGHEEKLSESASAIQVVTGEDIHRSGASSLPEALQLAPNLQVAQINSHDWAICARGFNATVANKLLVMVDGRTIYTPFFGGIFWDTQNIMLEDIDRIEVISGPAATLWGANAVNGVINIVTKNAKETQGSVISAGGGSLLNEFGSFRYGDKIGNDLFFRIYGMGVNRDETLMRNGRYGSDDWFMGQGGFRLDWLPDDTNRMFTVEGNAYGGDENLDAVNKTSVDGQNLLARWTQSLYEGSDISVQGYFDHTFRLARNSYQEDLKTYDASVQHRLTFGERQTLTWGAGFRYQDDEVRNIGPVLRFFPRQRNLHLYSGFLQDEISLVPDKLTLTLGTKIEHNSYSGFEVQPSGRLGWEITEKQVLWGAISRAVRSPSRIDSDFGATLVNVGGNTGRLDPNPNFDSEKLLSFELGYRVRPFERLSLSIATYYNFYDDLRSVDQVATNIVMLDNHFQGETWGAELSGSFQATDWWRLRGGYDYFHKQLSPTDPTAVPTVREGNDPHHIFKLQSIMDFRGFVKDNDHFQFDVSGRYYDTLPEPHVPSYISCDVRLAWEYKERLEIAIVGQNLLDDQHPEFGASATRLEIPRSVYAKVTWRF